jgi:photosystem II stability/assembly factor-like uncharacterized protein
MNDDELERRLRDHYRGTDPLHAPAGLEARVDGALDGRVGRPRVVARARPLAISVLAAAAVLAVVAGVGLRPGGFLLSIGATRTPSVVVPTAAAPTGDASAPVTSPTDGPTASPAPDASTVDLAGTFAGGGLWAVSGDRLLTSTDAGATWRTGSVPVGRQVSGVDMGPLRVAFVLDADHAWTVTAGAGSTAFNAAPTDALKLVVSRTSDGGGSWTTVRVPGSYPGAIIELVFIDRLHGYLLCAATRMSLGGSTVLRTDDGGATWIVAGNVPTLGSQLAASDASTVWAGAEQEAGPTMHPILDVSRDGGRTWQEVRLPGLEGRVGGAQTYLPGPPLFLDPRTGFVTVVTSEADGTTTTRILETSDGGRTWTETARQPVAASAGLVILDATHWLLPTYNTFGLQATDDGGATWLALAPTGSPNGGWITWAGGLGSGAVAAIEPSNNTSLGPAWLEVSTDGGRTWHTAMFAAGGPVASP